MAPDFTLPSNTGKDISLKDLLKKAKHTVLYFYPGEHTPPASQPPFFLTFGPLLGLRVYDTCQAFRENLPLGTTIVGVGAFLQY